MRHLADKNCITAFTLIGNEVGCINGIHLQRNGSMNGLLGIFPMETACIKTWQKYQEKED